MSLFSRVFIKILALLSAVLVFFIIISLGLNFLSKNYKSKIFTYSNGDIESLNKIAILKINGPILNEPSISYNFNFFSYNEIIYVSKIKEILRNLETENIKGLIVSINSPGGSVSASYNLNELFNKFKNKTNIKIFFHANELLTSGAYWVALSGNKIYANYGSLIGSIGVKGPDWIYFDEPLAISEGLFGNSIETKKGIKKFNNIAGVSKDLFDPFRPPTKKEIKELQIGVQNIYSDFVNEVSKNRKIETEIIVTNIGAMIYDTKTAKHNFLIDDTATLETVIKEMVDDLNLDNFQIIEIKDQEISFVQKLLEVNSLNNSLLDYALNSQIIDICNVLKFQLSSMVIQNKLILKC